MARGRYIKDVDISPSTTNPKAVCVHVPFKGAGTYTTDDITLARTATLYMPPSRVHRNKTQDGTGFRERGYVILNPEHTYTLTYTDSNTSSIHDEPRRVVVRLTGEEIYQNNEAYGRPHQMRVERMRAPEIPSQLRLFDPSRVSPLDLETAHQTDLPGWPRRADAPDVTGEDIEF